MTHSLSDQRETTPANIENGTSTTSLPVSNLRRPSEGWLRNPAWIDGGVNPPQFYHSHEEIDDACREAGVPLPPRYIEDPEAVDLLRFAPRLSGGIAAALAIPLATQCDILSARVSPTPLNDHYRNNEVAEPFRSSVVQAEIGHLVNTTHAFTLLEPAGGRNMRAGPKKKKTSMLGNIVLSGITRVKFIEAFLAIHTLNRRYSPGAHSGPEFKLSWTGSAGGKSGAPSILTDQNFNIALAAILLKDRSKIQVSVEFDSDLMSGFRIEQPIGTVDIPDPSGDELTYGVRIPHVGSFTDAEQINGRFVLELKKKWPCAAHQGEHSETGFCYITNTGDHIRLNPLRLKMWAAAIATQDATKHEPPSVEAFDGPRDGRLYTARMRGRSGPANTAVTPGSTSNEMMTLLMASLIPIIGGLSRKRSHSRSQSPRRRASSSTFSHTILSPRTPKRLRHNSRALCSPTSGIIPSSPLPAAGFELRCCLRDFAKLEGIDMTAFEHLLTLEEYTPEIIPFLDDSVLRTILGAPGGRIVKLKIFCKEWQARYELKVRNPSYITFQPL